MHHGGQVLDAVLAVGVERGEDLGSRLLTGVFDPGLDGRALAQIDRMSHHVSPGPQGDIAGAVGTAVVHAHHMAEGRPQLRDHLADDGGFVEGGNDDPDVGVMRINIHFHGHLGPQITRLARAHHLLAYPARASASR